MCFAAKSWFWSKYNNVIVYEIKYINASDIPISQLTPENPGAQTQLYPFIASKQVPPEPQGFEAHSSMSVYKSL
jgi:hypothetical protein